MATANAITSTWIVHPEISDTRTKEILASLDKLQSNLLAIRKDKVDFGRHKIVWKVACFQQALIYRSATLLAGVQCCWNQRNIVGAAILARAIIEVAAVAHSFEKRLTNAIEDGDVRATHKIVEDIAYATRHPDLSELPKAQNIITIIEKVDRDLFPEERALSWYYNLLSEFSHPNYPGTQGNFGKLERRSKRTSFSFDCCVNERNCRTLASATSVGELILVSVNKTTTLLPRIAELNEAELGDEQ